MTEQTMVSILTTSLEFGCREVEDREGGKDGKEVHEEFKPDWIFSVR